VSPFVVRGLAWTGSILFLIGFVITWNNHGEPTKLAFVFIAISVAISLGFAVRKGFLVLREMLTTRSL
jgi:hypothetical protein